MHGLFASSGQSLIAWLAPAFVPGATVARGLFSPGVLVRSTLTFAVSLTPVPHPGTLRSSVVVAFPIVSIPTLATAVESTPLVVVVVTSRLVLPFSRSAVPIVSGALIAFPPSIALRLLPLYLAATKVVIPRASREAAPVFLIHITFVFDGVDPDGVFLRYATQSHTCSADLLNSSTHVVERHIKRANAGTSLLTDARETLQPELDVG